MATVRSTWRAAVEQDGYVVISDVLPKDNVQAVVLDIWQHIGARPDDRESWYKPGLVSAAGMVEMYHYQSLWNNRQHPRIYEVFRDIMGTDRLWVSLDRANFKPPADPKHPEHDHHGFIHWDTDTSRWPNIPFRVQGVLALEDTPAELGGFQCVPELYRNLAEWIPRQPQNRDPRKPDLTGYAITHVPMKAGDVVIWTTLLPHGNGHNVSNRPRLAQYITMGPADDANEELRQKRINCWRNREPLGGPFKGDPRKIEETSGKTAELTPLGRKLLGLDRW